jgi:hypothetical protein
LKKKERSLKVKIHYEITIHECIATIDYLLAHEFQKEIPPLASILNLFVYLCMQALNPKMKVLNYKQSST